MFCPVENSHLPDRFSPDFPENFSTTCGKLCGQFRKIVGKSAHVKGFSGFYPTKVGFSSCGQVLFGAILMRRQFSTDFVINVVESGQISGFFVPCVTSSFSATSGCFSRAPTPHVRWHSVTDGVLTGCFPQPCGSISKLSAFGKKQLFSKIFLSFINPPQILFVKLHKYLSPPKIYPDFLSLPPEKQGYDTGTTNVPL